MIFPGDPAPVPVRSIPLPSLVTIPRHLAARWVEAVARTELVAALRSITPDLVDTLPEGPSAEHRGSTSFAVIVDIVGIDGRRVRGTVEGRDAYGTTGVIAVEAARRLVTDPPGPGVLAAAQAYDPSDFLNFLTPYGVTWTIDHAC
jgi:hypothetical protein